MLKLKNVSKYYYSKGVVASGFTKVNLELEIGEFVVITGESGSGKSTLLNVISGLDTYEDGEMYINGLETSHYGETDFEEYRKKYIGNIFQNFNLVNSYTVYQNIELVLLLNGFKKRNIKKQVLKIIEEVDLTKYKNTKCSRLSGGQKQRVAIARALAKDTSIIVADEPTGNLDSKSAKSVLKLLHEISKDKLVVIVTHNYDQVEEYATRKIRMHDGKILEDIKIKKIASDAEAKAMEYKEMDNFNKFRLGLRNTFNVKSKFLLILMVLLFLTFSVIGQYSAVRKQKADQEGTGMNQYFKNIEAERLIIQKKDLTAFSEKDYNYLNKLDNVEKIIPNDIFLDLDVSLQGEEYFFIGRISDIEKFNEKLDVGRMPENKNEIIIKVNRHDYFFSSELDNVMKTDFSLNTIDNLKKTNQNKKIVGIKYIKEANGFPFNNSQIEIFTNESLLKELVQDQNYIYAKVKMKSNGSMYEFSPSYTPFRLISTDKVKEGEMYVPEDARGMCKNYRCINTKITIDIENMYFNDQLTLKVTKEYTNKNFKKLLELTNIDEYYGVYFINPVDFAKLFDKGNFQGSIFVTEVHKIDKTIKSLEENNYRVLRVKDAIVNPFLEDLYQISDIVMFVFLSILTVGIFFVSYFIIKLILKSRNIYFSTIRILGASKNVAKQLLKIELFTVLNIAYGIFLTLVFLVQNKYIEFEYIRNLSMYLKSLDYIILYLVLAIISYLIANRFAKKLFVKSAMNTYREEV